MKPIRNGFAAVGPNTRKLLTALILTNYVDKILDLRIQSCKYIQHIQ